MDKRRRNQPPGLTCLDIGTIHPLVQVRAGKLVGRRNIVTTWEQAE